MIRLLRRTCALFVVVSCCVSAQAADILFTAQADKPMATLTREHGMVRGVVDEPLVTVYGDGLVRVNRAPYMINPGVTEYRLDADALKQLVIALSATFDLDAERLTHERDAAAESLARNTGEQFVTLDSTITRISVELDGFSRNGKSVGPVNKSLSFADVQEQALRYNVDSLQALARAESALLDLMKEATNAREGDDANQK
jgi:hypothetical protein